MKIKRVSERILRNCEDRKTTVESAEFNIIDNNGVTIGRISSMQSYSSLNLSVGSENIEDGVAKIAAILNAEVEGDGKEAEE